MGKTYDASVDYMAKIKEAEQRGDREQAAYYEEKRNEKIKGEGLTQYTPTHDYEAYLPKTTAKKMEEVLEKMKNPFAFKIGKYVVKTTFEDETGCTIGDCVDALLIL